MAGLRISLALCLGLTAGVATMSASTFSLQDFGINANGSVSDAGAGGTPFSVSGVSAGGFDQTTGLGSLTYTYNPGPGTYFVNFFVDQGVAIPYFNEYGIVGGTPGSGVSYQIDESQLGTVYSNFSTNKFDNKNDLPGTGDNYLQGCAYVSGGTCNGDVAFGVGFKFTLGAKQEEKFTLTGSTTNPGGFYLEGVHPIDGGNSSATDYFLTASGSTVPTCTGPNCGPPPPPQSPEPASELLAGGGLLFIGLVWPKLRRRSGRS